MPTKQPFSSLGNDPQSLKSLLVKLLTSVIELRKWASDGIAHFTVPFIISVPRIPHSAMSMSMTCLFTTVASIS